MHSHSSHRFVCRVISNPLCFFLPPTPVDQIRPLPEDIHPGRTFILVFEFETYDHVEWNIFVRRKGGRERGDPSIFSLHLSAFNAFETRVSKRFQPRINPLPSFVLLLVLELNQFPERGIHRWSLEERRDSVSIPFLARVESILLDPSRYRWQKGTW